MKELRKNVFPFYILNKQKGYMKQNMRKPCKLKVRKLVATITSRNNELVFYPGGNKRSKLSKKGLVKLIKWLLLPLWLQKFKKKGYIPLLDSKKKLIQEYKIIKRQEAAKSEQKKKENKSKRKKVGKVNPKTPKATKNKERKKTFYCSHYK